MWKFASWPGMKKVKHMECSSKPFTQQYDKIWLAQYIKKKNTHILKTREQVKAIHNSVRFNYPDKTYVHGIVKNMWIGTFSASATWVCPKEVFNGY